MCIVLFMETSRSSKMVEFNVYIMSADSRGKESELYRDHSSQVKRRRMLQFESEVLETPLCNDEDFLRSKVDARTIAFLSFSR